MKPQKNIFILFLFLIFLFFLWPLNSQAILVWESNYGSLVQQNPSINTGITVGTTNYNLGFNFQFYDKTYNNLWINSVGTVSFSAYNQQNGSNQNTMNEPVPTPQDFLTLNANKQIPQPYESGAMIAPLWDFLLTNPNAKEDGSYNPNTGVWANVLGETGSRSLVLTWNDVSHFSNGGSPTFYGSDTFQLVLYEGSNNIMMSYLNLDGVQNPYHSGGVYFPSTGNYVPNDVNGITIGVNAGDFPSSYSNSIVRGTQYMYGFDNSQLPEGNSIYFIYDPNYYSTGVGGYTYRFVEEGDTSPVPEPSTFLLFIPILVIMFFRLRKNNIIASL